MKITPSTSVTTIMLMLLLSGIMLLNWAAFPVSAFYGTVPLNHDTIQCQQHHEYAVFFSADDFANILLIYGAQHKQRPSFLKYVNQNGHTKHYFCRPCRPCGEGVVILTRCDIRRDTVCSNICLDREWVYNEELDRCHPARAEATENTSLGDGKSIVEGLVAATLAGTFFRTTIPGVYASGQYLVRNGYNKSGINDVKKEIDSVDTNLNKCTYEIILITVGVLTLFIMVAIILIRKNRDLERKKMAERRNRQERQSREQNNTSQTTGTVSSSVQNNSGTNRDMDPFMSVSTPAVNGSVVVNPDTSTNRVKESNLNHYIVNFPPSIESDISATYISSHIDVPETKVQPGTNPYWIEMSAYFGPQGGQLCCDQSDVIVQIPPGAIPTSHSRQLIVARVSRTPGFFPVELDKEALFLTPVVDCESPGLKKFDKNVVIKLPHRAHLGPDWHFAVHYTDGLYTGQVLSHWSTEKISCEAARRDLLTKRTTANINRTVTDLLKSDVQFTIDGKHVHISTPHFSKYVCSGCSKKRELSLEAVVYVNDIQLNPDRRVDLHCYLLDSIKDFKNKVNYNEPCRPHSEHKPLVIRAKHGKQLEVSLIDMGEDWPWQVDERIHKNTQFVNLDNIVRCHSDVVPDFVTFTLRPRYPDQNTSSLQSGNRNTYLEAAVRIKQKSMGNGIIVDVALNLDGKATEHIGEQDALKENQVRLNDACTTLSNNITATQWRPMYRSIMKTMSGCSVNVEAEISFIENKDPHDLREQIYQGFQKWILVCGKNATIERLCASLREVGLVKLAEKIESTSSKLPADAITNIEETAQVDEDHKEYTISTQV